MSDGQRQNVEIELIVPLVYVRDVFVTDGSRVSAATVASTAIAAAQWAVTQVIYYLSIIQVHITCSLVCLFVFFNLFIL